MVRFMIAIRKLFRPKKEGEFPLGCDLGRDFGWSYQLLS